MLNGYHLKLMYYFLCRRCFSAFKKPSKLKSKNVLIHLKIQSNPTCWDIPLVPAEPAAKFRLQILDFNIFQYDSIEWKVQHFYESCKSLDYIESDKEKPLIKIVNNLGGWDVLRTFNLYNWDPHRLISLDCWKTYKKILERNWGLATNSY